MAYLTKVLYRKYLEDARQARREINMPAWHCIFTGLDFNAKTRTASYWERMNRIQQLRTEG
ncbi:hypothetical protein [Achromobacter xylosoxidans]|uniref:hypothetical protein n=1 Tax=Alcaligenes xylosoxydans xylosoxydans TaxID=85698 RepID=UPI0038FCE0C8